MNLSRKSAVSSLLVFSLLASHASANVIREYQGVGVSNNLWKLPVLLTGWENINEVTLIVNAYESLNNNRGDRFYYWESSSQPGWEWTTMLTLSVTGTYVDNVRYLTGQGAFTDELFSTGLSFCQGQRDELGHIASIRLIVDSDTDYAVIAVPEPSSLAVLSSVVVGLLATGRTRARGVFRRV
ncbi:MAG: hypothetical protein IT443_02195 [Phycisphaeraceae bacterium]|nr:hypothetical protein [Phycisphaeraceae bacterium]